VQLSDGCSFQGYAAIFIDVGKSVLPLGALPDFCDDLRGG